MIHYLIDIRYLYLKPKIKRLISRLQGTFSLQHVECFISTHLQTQLSFRAENNGTAADSGAILQSAMQ